MKANKGKGGSITQPLLKDLIERQKVNSKITFDKTCSTVDNTPQPQPDLYQDQGGGYNVNFVFPQD